MKITSLKETPLVEYLKPYMVSYIRRCNPDNCNNTISPTYCERMAFEIIFGVSNITECIDQLYYSIDLLSEFKKNNTKLNRHNYIIYTMENFYLRITSVFDRCLRLSNQIFDIGIPERECRENTIIKNTKIKGTPVEKALKNLNKFTANYRAIRNSIAHANSFNDPDLNKIEGFNILEDTNDKKDEKLKPFRPYFRKITDKYVAEKKMEFLQKVQELESIVELYFNSVLPRIKIIIEKNDLNS